MSNQNTTSYITEEGLGGKREGTGSNRLSRGVRGAGGLLQLHLQREIKVVKERRKRAKEKQKRRAKKELRASIEPVTSLSH